MRTDEKALLERVRTLSPIDDAAELRAELEGLRPEDIAEAFTRMDDGEQTSILSLLDAGTAADVLVELPTESARRLIEELPDEIVAHYLDILPMDDAIELREVLEPQRFEALLQVIPEEDAQELRRLMAFPDGSAGQLLTENFVEVGPMTTMAAVLNMIREASDEDFETVNYIYVLSEDQHLLGLLTLRRVLRANPEQVAREVMNPDPITASAYDSAESVARTLARYGFSAIPLLDQRGRMLGILTADDAQEVLSEADTEDVLKLGGVSGDAEAYLSLSVIQLAKRRLPWLLILFVAETLTGAVLRNYIPDESQTTSAQFALIAKLTLFIPLLIGAGGNAGSQVTTTITRALAVGEVRPSDVLRVMRRELVVALLIGAALGILAFGRALLGWNSGFDVSLTVGIALPCIVLWAAIVGSLLPLGAKRLNIDPAVMSAPFITTFVDATGLIIYFEIARRILGLTFTP